MVNRIRTRLFQYLAYSESITHSKICGRFWYVHSLLHKVMSKRPIQMAFGNDQNQNDPCVTHTSCAFAGITTYSTSVESRAAWWRDILTSAQRTSFFTQRHFRRLSPSSILQYLSYCHTSCPWVVVCQYSTILPFNHNVLCVY
jgi:hypothetical protein